MHYYDKYSVLMLAYLFAWADNRNWSITERQKVKKNCKNTRTRAWFACTISTKTFRAPLPVSTYIPLQREDSSTHDRHAVVAALSNVCCTCCFTFAVISMHFTNLYIMCLCEEVSPANQWELKQIQQKPGQKYALNRRYALRADEPNNQAIQYELIYAA